MDRQWKNTIQLLASAVKTVLSIWLPDSAIDRISVGTQQPKLVGENDGLVESNFARGIPMKSCIERNIYGISQFIPFFCELGPYTYILA